MQPLPLQLSFILFTLLHKGICAALVVLLRKGSTTPTLI